MNSFLCNQWNHATLMHQNIRLHAKYTAQLDARRLLVSSSMFWQDSTLKSDSDTDKNYLKIVHIDVWWYIKSIGWLAGNRKGYSWNPLQLKINCYFKNRSVCGGFSKPIWGTGFIRTSCKCFEVYGIDLPEVTSTKLNKKHYGYWFISLQSRP